MSTNIAEFGAIDCDIHPAVPNMRALLPYLDEYWRDAIVSRGGRPDLAGSRLAAVRAPTLLLVGGHDPVVLELSRRAQAALTCENRLAIVPGATHLFEEPGALEAVAAQAGDWFTRYLAPLVEARS